MSSCEVVIVLIFCVSVVNANTFATLGGVNNHRSWRDSGPFPRWRRRLKRLLLVPARKMPQNHAYSGNC